MNKKDLKFLNNKLTELAENHIISKEQLEKSQNYFLNKKSDKNISVIFGAIGIFLIALSIITLFAMNWTDIPKGIKVIISFVPIILASIMVYKYMLKEDKKFGLYTSIFAPIAIIATNSLLSQVFHMQTEIYELFFTSLLMFMPITFILRNFMSILIYGTGSVIYAFVAIESYGSESEALFKILIIALPLLIFNIINYIKNKEDRTNVLAWIANAILLTLFLFHKELLNEEAILMYLYMLYFATLTLFSKNNPLSKILSFAFLGYLLLSCTTSEMLEFTEDLEIHLDTLLFAILAGLFIFLSNAYKEPKEYFIFAFITLAQFTNMNSELLFVIANILAIALGIYRIILGSEKDLHSETKKGLAIILIVIMFRFISADLSFGTKSILFLISGIVFMLGGKLSYKKVSELKGGSKND